MTTILEGSRVVLGAAGWGAPYGIRGLVPSDADIDSILGRAYELGIREIDTAPAYGTSESRVAKSIVGRDFVVRTKVSRGTAENQLRSVENSLRLFGTRLSLLQFHNYEPSDEPALRELQGKTGLGVGATTYGPENAAAAYRSFGCVQLEWNLLNHRALAAIPPRALRAGEAMDNEVSVRSVLLQGVLAGVSIPAHLAGLRVVVQKLKEAALTLSLSLPAFALAAAFAHPEIDRILLGVDDAEQLVPLAEALAADAQLVQQALKRIDTTVSDVRLLDPRLWRQLAETLNH